MICDAASTPFHQSPLLMTAGFLDNDCTQKKKPWRAKIFSSCQPRRRINTSGTSTCQESRHYISDYVVTLTPTIQWRGQQNRWVQPRPDSTLSQREQLWLVRVNVLHCCTRHQHNMTRADIEFANDGQGFLRGIDCTCWLGRKKPCRKLVTMKNFAIPYWDWTWSKTQCDPAICSEELLGVPNQVDGTVKGKYFDNMLRIIYRFSHS